MLFMLQTKLQIPGTPKEHVQTLRRAFQETLRDKEFLADVVKAKLDLDPISGEEVHKIVTELFDLDSPLVSKLHEILYGKKG